MYKKEALQEDKKKTKNWCFRFSEKVWWKWKTHWYKLMINMSLHTHHVYMGEMQGGEI